MEIVGVAGDVAVEGRKRRGYYGHGTKESTDVVLAVTMVVAGESRTFLQAGWPDGENWKTKIGCLSNLFNRGCSSITIFCWQRCPRGELTRKARKLCAGRPSLEDCCGGRDYDWRK